jgi:hypothetical protein
VARPLALRGRRAAYFAHRKEYVTHPRCGGDGAFLDLLAKKDIAAVKAERRDRRADAEPIRTRARSAKSA